MVQERPDLPSTTTESTEKGSSLLPDLLPAEAQDQLKKLSFPIHIDMDDITGVSIKRDRVSYHHWLVLAAINVLTLQQGNGQAN